MKKIKSDITKLLILVLFLLLVIIINLYVSIKEGVNMPEDTGFMVSQDNAVFHILLKGSGLYLVDNKLSTNRIQINDITQNPNGGPKSKWKFYNNNNGGYNIQNISTNRFLGFKTDSDGKTYLVSYPQSDILKVEPNSYNWNIRFKSIYRFKTEIPTMLISNNSKFGYIDANRLVKTPFTNPNIDEYITLVYAK